MRTVFAVIGCVIFLTIATAVWLAFGRSWLVLILLFLPSYAVSEYLGFKLFDDDRGLLRGMSTTKVGFSISRIIYGVVLGCLLIAGMYGVAWLLSRLFS